MQVCTATKAGISTDKLHTRGNKLSPFHHLESQPCSAREGNQTNTAQATPTPSKRVSMSPLIVPLQSVLFISKDLVTAEALQAVWPLQRTFDPRLWQGQTVYCVVYVSPKLQKQSTQHKVREETPEASMRLAGWHGQQNRDKKLLDENTCLPDVDGPGMLSSVSPKRE